MFFRSHIEHLLYFIEKHVESANSWRKLNGLCNIIVNVDVDMNTYFIVFRNERTHNPVCTLTHMKMGEEITLKLFLRRESVDPIHWSQPYFESKFAMSADNSGDQYMQLLVKLNELLINETYAKR